MTGNIEQPKDSSKLQFMSLVAFMNQLGYTYIQGKFYGPKPAEVIHFGTGVKLHNSVWDYTCKEKALYIPHFHYAQRQKSPFCIDGCLLRKALAAKIIDDVHLQANKKGEVKVMKHWVRFTSYDAYIVYKGVLALNTRTSANE